MSLDEEECAGPSRHRPRTACRRGPCQRPGGFENARGRGNTAACAEHPEQPLIETATDASWLGPARRGARESLGWPAAELKAAAYRVRAPTHTAFPGHRPRHQPYMGYGVLEVEGRTVRSVVLGDTDPHRLSDPYEKLRTIFERVGGPHRRLRPPRSEAPPRIVSSSARNAAEHAQARTRTGWAIRGAGAAECRCSNTPPRASSS